MCYPVHAHHPDHSITYRAPRERPQGQEVHPAHTGTETSAAQRPVSWILT